jgi:uncharacterized protein (TIGR02757 family)
MIPNLTYIKSLLERKVFEYNRVEFIPDDPIAIPHGFSRKEDIEISGFLASTIAWGQRRTILANARRLMDLMDGVPYEFLAGCTDKDLERFHGFQHRTFNGVDCVFFLRSLKNIYIKGGGMEVLFTPKAGEGMIQVISRFRKTFFSVPYPARSAKHIADPEKGSSAKRINMFLRWMVRRDDCGVDFGIWRGVSPAALYCPLDVHTGQVARALGILTAKQDNWKAVEELTGFLRLLDPEDPVKYDYALFGMGIEGRFKV